MLYAIARKFLASLKWIGLALIIGLVISVAANIAVMKPTDFSSTIIALGLTFIFRPGLPQTVLWILIGSILLLALVSWMLTAGEARSISDKVIRRYLQRTIEANQGLNPSGFAQQSQALISVNVPLNDIFIHLHAVPDRPIYDVPGEQQKLLEELRQRTDLKLEEREELIQRLRVIWYSQTAQDIADKRQRSNIAIDEVLEQLTATNPVAIMLGTPGSGKSTVLRWLTLHMAQATLSPEYRIPSEDDDDWDDDDDDLYEEDVRRIPILLRISDYAKQLSKEDISFTDFFKNHLATLYPDLPGLANSLLGELARGQCLLLLDGLDEVASDDLRRRVAQTIEKFIASYAKAKPDALQWNMFIITSRIVGYEPGTFTKYAHYTLLDFEDEQIEQFLGKWCPAVERYQTMFAQGMKPLTSQQEAHVKLASDSQRDLLLRALANNSSIKRLAVNPLMLTILALIQRSGKTLPHRRIELYQIVTRTLLDNWNKGSERRVFPIEEVPLAEQLLGNLAYQLHSTDPVLTEQEVKNIAQRTMEDFYGHTNGQIRESDINKFINTLRSSSGLFIESGQGLFNFMHRTFQEYFVALYLLRKTPAELRQFAITHYHTAIWREPLLLAIAYKSGQSSRTERQEASDLIQAIKDTSDEFDTVLHHNLLFAANSVVDCSAWSIDKQLQYDIAYTLLDLYGDEFGYGRYKRLQHEIEKVTLLWLRGQPQESSQKNTLPPLLMALHDALHASDQTVRHEGALHLLAELASNLTSCPLLVQRSLLPPLVRMTRLTDLPCPSEVDMSQAATSISVSPLIEYFAWEVLRQLKKPGPMNWAYESWYLWLKKKPESLVLLNTHLEELNIRAKSLNHLCKYLLSKLTERELLEAARGQAWETTWQVALREEMARGRYATYQPCLSLRLLLCETDKQQQRELANELIENLSIRDQQQRQALIVIMIVYLSKLETEVRQKQSEYDPAYDEEDELLPPSVYPVLPRRYTLYRAWRRSSARRLLQSKGGKQEEWDSDSQVEDKYVSSDHSFRRPQPPPRLATRSYPIRRRGYPVRQSSTKRRLTLAQRWRHLKRATMRNVRKLREALPRWVPFALQDDDVYEPDQGASFSSLTDSKYDEAPTAQPLTLTLLQIAWQEILELQDMQCWFHILKNTNMLHNQDIHELETTLNSDEIIHMLCSLVNQPTHTNLSIELLALHIVLATHHYILPSMQEEVKACITVCENQPSLTDEQRLIITKLQQRLQGAGGQQETPSKLALILTDLQRRQQLTKRQAESILSASIDTRRLIFAPHPDIPTYSGDRRLSTYNAVYDIAWDLLTQQFELEPEAQTIIVQALDDQRALVCATAARLLQNSLALQPDVRKEATQKILRILSDSTLSRRPLDAPDKRDWRLDNILFDTLQALAEQAR